MVVITVMMKIQKIQAKKKKKKKRNMVVVVNFVRWR